MVRMMIIEKRLQARVEVIVSRIRMANNPYHAINPSGRVPTPPQRRAGRMAQRYSIPSAEQRCGGATMVLPAYQIARHTSGTRSA